MLSILTIICSLLLSILISFLISFAIARKSMDEACNFVLEQTDSLMKELKEINNECIDKLVKRFNH